MLASLAHALSGVDIQQTPEKHYHTHLQHLFLQSSRQNPGCLHIVRASLTMAGEDLGIACSPLDGAHSKGSEALLAPMQQCRVAMPAHLLFGVGILMMHV